MKQLYLIRHGDADYEHDCLTDEGRARVRGLSRSLSELLPKGIRYSILSSPSRRAKETAQLLLPMLREKSGEMAYIDEDARLSELRSMGNKEEMRRYGAQNLVLLDEYDSEIGIFTSHERLIKAMAFAIADKFGIVLPAEFYPGQAYRNLKVKQIMKKHKITEEKAIAAVRELPDPFMDHSAIRPGYALNFDLESRVVSFVTPDY